MFKMAGSSTDLSKIKEDSVGDEAIALLLKVELVAEE